MKRFSIFIALFFSVGIFMGCSSRWEQSPVIDQKEVTVTLEHKVVKDQIVEQQFNHPFNINIQNMEVLLTQLEYLDEYASYKDPERKPVFQKEEVERLAPALVSALSKATPAQRVRFVSYNQAETLFFLKTQRKTGGVLFVEEGRRLNIAFGFVNKEIRDNSDLNRWPREGDSTEPLEIKSCYTPIIAPAYAVHSRTQSGKEYPMWIVADIEKIDKPAASVLEAETARPEAKPEPEGELFPEKGVSEKIVPEHKPAVKESGDSWESRKEDIKRKLEYLKELYESDLIDAEEYDNLKKKLLDRLQLK